MNLFLTQAPTIEKTASATPLMGNSSNWEQEILAALYKEAPYLGQYRVDLSILGENRESGHLYGYFLVSPQTGMPANPTDTTAIQTPEQVQQSMSADETAGVRIPVIVTRMPQAVTLKPFDVMISADGQTQPLTEQRIAEVMSSASQFTATARPDGMAGAEISADQSVYRGSGMVQDLPKMASLLECIAPGLGELDKALFLRQLDTPEMRYALDNNQAFRAAVGTLYHEKTATAREIEQRSLSVLEPTAVLIEKTASGYRVTSAVSSPFAPVVTEIPAREAHVLPPGVLREVHETGCSMRSPGESDHLSERLNSLQPSHTKTAGLYRVPCGSSDWATCAVIGKVYSESAELRHVQMTVELDGATSHRFATPEEVPVLLGMEKVAGMLDDDATLHAVRAVLEAEPGRGQQSHIFVEPSLKAAIGPIKIAHVMQVNGQTKMWNDRGTEVIKTAGLSSPAMTSHGLLIPDSWYAVSANSQTLRVADPELRKEAVLAMSGDDRVTVLQTGASRFDFRGGCGVGELNEELRSNLTKTASLLLLGCLGFSRVAAEGILKQASRGTREAECMSRCRVEDYAKRKAKTKEKIASRQIELPKVNLLKEAAMLSSMQSIDQMLALGFLNDDNVQAFLDKRGELEQTLRGLCGLLIAVRYGLEDVPESAVERSVKGITQVIDGLNALEARMQTPS